MNEVLAKVQQIGVIPVIAIEDAAKAVPLARALTAGGIALLIHLSGLTSLDVSYLAPFSDARARRAVLRPLLARQKWRDATLHPQDLKNQGDGQDENRK